MLRAVKKGVYEVLPMQIYDLANDPQELSDLAALNPQIVARAESIMARRTQSVYPAWNF